MPSAGSRTGNLLFKFLDLRRSCFSHCACHFRVLACALRALRACVHARRGGGVCSGGEAPLEAFSRQLPAGWLYQKRFVGW